MIMVTFVFNGKPELTQRLIPTQMIVMQRQLPARHLLFAIWSVRIAHAAQPAITGTIPAESNAARPRK